MSELEELIQKLCPNGVEFVPLWSVTAWDKRFNGVNRSMQSKIVPHKYYLSAEFDRVERSFGDVLYLPTGVTQQNRYTTVELAGDYLSEGEIICIPWGGTPNVKYYEGKYVTGDNRIATSLDTNKLSNKYLYYVLQNSIDLISSFYRGAGIQHPNMAAVLSIMIPLPPLPVQREIVRILDSFTELTAELNKKLEEELAARRKQYEHYRDELLTFGDEVPRIPLGEVGPVCMCKRILKSQTNDVGGVPFYKIGTFGKQANAYISKETYEEYHNKYNFPKKGDILISAAGTIGRTVVYDGEPAYFQDSNIVWVANDETKILNRFLIHCYAMKPWYVSTGGTIARLYNDNILKAVVPVPYLERQKFIVDTLDRFDTLCNDLTSGLPAEITARQKQYEYYRDKLLTFKELEG